MNHMARRVSLLLMGMVVLGLMGVVAPNTSKANAPGEEAMPVPSSTQNYSGLADLITMICDDALERFQGFYGPSVVTVEPFTTFDPSETPRQSLLGMTLADQMTAVINNDTLTSNRASRETTPQSMQGVLQEVDGYLRIHISGVNGLGERTSYVVTVEMSDPIYRALHNTSR